MIPVYKTSGKKLPFSGAFSQSIEILLPGNCHQFGSNKLIKIFSQVWTFLTSTKGKRKNSLRKKTTLFDYFKL